MGYDGLELACWGDHFDVTAAIEQDGYVADHALHHHETAYARRLRAKRQPDTDLSRALRHHVAQNAVHCRSRQYEATAASRPRTSIVNRRSAIECDTVSANGSTPKIASAGSCSRMAPRTADTQPPDAGRPNKQHAGPVVDGDCSSGEYNAIGGASASPWKRSLPTTPTIVRFVRQKLICFPRVFLAVKKSPGPQLR